jgi:hypothetical protein
MPAAPEAHGLRHQAAPAGRPGNHEHATSVLVSALLSGALRSRVRRFESCWGRLSCRVQVSGADAVVDVGQTTGIVRVLHPGEADLSASSSRGNLA